VKLLEAPLNVLQPFVDIFPLELYFGAALRTRQGRAVAEMTESRFEFSGAAFFGTGNLHYVRIKEFHPLTLRCNELRLFRMLTRLIDTRRSYAGAALAAAGATIIGLPISWPSNYKFREVAGREAFAAWTKAP
jgi:hypothetical protein